MLEDGLYISALTSMLRQCYTRKKDRKETQLNFMSYNDKYGNNSKKAMHFKSFALFYTDCDVKS